MYVLGEDIVVEQEAVAGAAGGSSKVWIRRGFIAWNYLNGNDDFGGDDGVEDDEKDWEKVGGEGREKKKSGNAGGRKRSTASSRCHSLIIIIDKNYEEKYDDGKENCDVDDKENCGGNYADEKENCNGVDKENFEGDYGVDKEEPFG